MESAVVVFLEMQIPGGIEQGPNVVKLGWLQRASDSKNRAGRSFLPRKETTVILEASLWYSDALAISRIDSSGN